MRGKAQKAYTLIEASISIAVLALALSVVLVSFGAARADLRKSAGMLSGTIRATYDNASLTGQIHRLVFSFDKDEETGDPMSDLIKVEATEEILSFDENANALSRGARSSAESGSGFGGFSLGGLDANELDDELDDVEDQGPPTALQALLGLGQGARDQSSTTFQSIGHDLDLGDGVHVLDIWVRGMDEPASEGVVYLYFFPHGYTQEAYIHLEDSESVVFTIRVHALTGKTEVFSEYKETPK